MRLAVAEEITEDVLAPRLGRAVRFALFDVAGKDIRGPFYRVRHDDPGKVCDEQAALAALLHDCKVVITGSVGPRMAAFRSALSEACKQAPRAAKRTLLTFIDPTWEPIAAATTEGVTAAWGVPDNLKF